VPHKADSAVNMARHAQHRLALRWVLVLAVGISIMAQASAHFVRSSNAQLPETERRLRIAEQLWRKRVALLQNTSLQHTDEEIDLDSLQVAVLESLDTLVHSPGIELLRYRFDESAHVASSDPALKAMTTLRLTIELRIAHAGELVQALNILARNVASHPLEIRACSLRRTAETKLKAACTLDIYYWESTAALPRAAEQKTTLGDRRLFFRAEQQPQSIAPPVKVPRKPAANEHVVSKQIVSPPPRPNITYTGYVSSNGQLQVLFNGVPWHGNSDLTWADDALQSSETARQVTVTLPSGKQVALTVGQQSSMESK